MNKINHKHIKLILIISGIVVALGLMGFLTYKFWSPLGKKVKISMKLPGAKKVVNIDTTNPTGGFKLPSQIITSQVARFPLDITSANIKNIYAIIKFKKGPKEIKLGVKGDEKDTYLYKPFYHMLIQEAQNWVKIQGISNILYQRNKNYNAIANLIETPPSKDKIGAYFINTETLVKNTLSKTDNKTVIDTYLRGTHTFYIWVDIAPLVLKVSKQDLNMYDGEDKFKIAIYKNDKKLIEKEIPDDGMTGKTLLKKDPQIESVELTNITPGIYRVELISDSKGSDNVITRIELNQNKIITKNLFILDKKPSTIYTDSNNLTVFTYHKESLQTIKINDKNEIKIEEINKKITTDLEELTKTKHNGTNLFKIYSPKNDIMYSSDDYFAFSTDQYFNPDIVKKVDLNTVEKLDEIDYILTTLIPAKQEGDWLVAEINFDPKDLNITDNKLYFSLESPELAKFGGELEIESFEVNIDYTGTLEKFVKKPTDTPNPTSVPTIEPTPSTAAQVKPTATPSAKPSTAAQVKPKPVVIKITNGGAPGGTGTRLVNKLKEMGYVNAKAENSSSKFTNANISYPVKYKDDLEAIESIIKTEYKFISRSSNYKDEIITINIGATKN